MAHTAQLTPPRLSLLLFPSPLDHTTPLLPSSSRERREERRDARHESACGCGVTRGVVVPAGSSSNTGWRWPLAASEAVEKNQEPRVLPRDLPLPCIRGDSLVPFFLRVFFFGLILFFLSSLREEDLNVGGYVSLGGFLPRFGNLEI